MSASGTPCIVPRPSEYLTSYVPSLLTAVTRPGPPSRLQPGDQSGFTSTKSPTLYGGAGGPEAQGGRSAARWRAAAVSEDTPPLKRRPVTGGGGGGAAAAISAVVVAGVLCAASSRNARGTVTAGCGAAGTGRGDAWVTTGTRGGDARGSVAPSGDARAITEAGSGGGSGLDGAGGPQAHGGFSAGGGGGGAAAGGGGAAAGGAAIVEGAGAALGAKALSVN